MTTKTRLLLINPNTTSEMTRIISSAAHGTPGASALDIVAVNPEIGPSAIETAADEQVAIGTMLASARSWSADIGFDIAVVSCFGDPGVDELRSATGLPVHGIALQAMRAAQNAGGRFSIVCAMPSAVTLMTELAARYGFGDALASVRPLGISVLDIARDPAAALEEAIAVIRSCVEVDGAGAVCLGCASMAPLAPAIEAESPVPVIEGVRAAVTAVLEDSLDR
ncbi:aspartate/glutamate racemase family protein [Rhodococcus sp. ABRD24]|uniref:aspartate/glutamate racemase family protein n=1 Tax=Rhodococcus sp. ABRD24 TaxID=2507582 RepID=UPI001040796D|nr:aspartate/glutamate racemase family protein [Rhodococcus sp. ABRD24]QBJ96048.1 aspartate/glutamate racemase family protein [Rhodococcus sp. ABRD24]